MAGGAQLPDQRMRYARRLARSVAHQPVHRVSAHCARRHQGLVRGLVADCVHVDPVDARLLAQADNGFKRRRGVVIDTVRAVRRVRRAAIDGRDYRRAWIRHRVDAHRAAHARQAGAAAAGR